MSAASAEGLPHTVDHGPGDGSLGDRLWRLPPGCVVRVQPGTYTAPVALPHDVALVAAQGLGSVTLRAQRGPVISVEGARRVRLEGLLLQGPEAGVGACLQVYMASEVEVIGCLLSGGRGRGEGGGAVDVQQGRVRLWRCRLTRGRAQQGGGVRAAGACRVELESCVLSDLSADGIGGGGLFASRNGSILARGCSFGRCRGALGAVALAGGGAGGPGTIELDHCLLAADAEESGRPLCGHQGGSVALRHCVVPRLQERPSDDGLHLGDGVVGRRVELAPQGERPFAPRFPGLLFGQGVAWSTSEPAPADAGWHAEEPRATPPAAHTAPASDVYGRPRGRLWIGAVGE